MKRHVLCFVEKAGFKPRTLGTKRSAMTNALHARLILLYYISLAAVGEGWPPRGCGLHAAAALLSRDRAWRRGLTPETSLRLRVASKIREQQPCSSARSHYRRGSSESYHVPKPNEMICTKAGYRILGLRKDDLR